MTTSQFANVPDDDASLPPDWPRYGVRLRPYATRTFTAAMVYVADTGGKEEAEADAYAQEFKNKLLDAIGTLATFPLRFPIAPEARHLAEPLVRVMPYRLHPASPVWRVLYHVYEADANDTAQVQIIAIRHGAQRPLTRSEGRDIDVANR